MRGAGRVLVAAFVFVPCAASAQGGNPLGPEFHVNTHPVDYFTDPAVASDSSGNFVVVWGNDYQDGSGYGLFGQRYASTGEPQGPEFRVNTYTTNDQKDPVVASSSSGNFVVVWESNNQDGLYSGVFGQRYASAGAPLGPEFRVNTFWPTSQKDPAVASDASGNFVVVWDSRHQDGSEYGVFGQRFASTGEPLGPEFRINTYTTSNQLSAAVASGSSGNFVVVWESWLQEGGGASSWGVFGQRYADTGVPLGPEFRVNTYTQSSQDGPSVASDASGNFVVVWQSWDGFYAGVFAQRYASTGEPLGPEFRVNTYTTSSQANPALASDSSGNFVVVWGSAYQDGSLVGVFGQRFASTGAPLGLEFRVNTYTTDSQGRPDVTSDSSDSFVVVWNRQTFTSFDIFGQRYGAIVPVELTSFEVE